MQVKRNVLSWSLGVFLAACGGATGNGLGGTSSGTGGTGATANTASEFVSAYCGLFVPCCVDAGLPGRGQSCQVLLDALLSQGTYNASAGQSCLQSSQQASTQPDFCSTGGSTVSCDGVLLGGSGTKGPGEPCSQGSECRVPPSGKATCYLQTVNLDGGTASSGSCVEETAGQAGQGPCLGTVNGDTGSSTTLSSGPPPSEPYVCNLAEGLTCNHTTKVCTVLAATGGPCEVDQDCIAGDYCPPYPDTTCAKRLADGAPCTPNVLSPCQTTSYCDPGSQTCKPLLADGSVCMLDQQCQSDSCTNGACGGSGNLSLALLCGQ